MAAQQPVSGENRRGYLPHGREESLALLPDAANCLELPGPGHIGAVRIVRTFVWNDARPDDTDEIRAAEVDITSGITASCSISAPGNSYPSGQRRVTQATYDEATGEVRVRSARTERTALGLVRACPYAAFSMRLAARRLTASVLNPLRQGTPPGWPKPITSTGSVSCRSRSTRQRSARSTRGSTGLERAAVGSPFSIVCECGAASCETALTVDATLYSSVRADPHRFLVMTGHEIPEAETVVVRHGDIAIVEKRPGEARLVTEATDPRSRTAPNNWALTVKPPRDASAETRRSPNPRSPHDRRRPSRPTVQPQLPIHSDPGPNTRTTSIYRVAAHVAPAVSAPVVDLALGRSWLVTFKSQSLSRRWRPRFAVR